MKKTLIVLALFCLFGLLAAPSIQAADFYVKCGSGCETEGTSPLFSESDLWYPGKLMIKTFSLKNVGSNTKEMVIGITSSWGDRELEKVMSVEIVKNSGGDVVWSKDTLEKFYSQGKISMGSFNPNDEVEFAIKVAMDSSAGNEYQNKKSQFNLTLGFWEEPVSLAPTPTGLIQGVRTAKVAGWYDGQGGPEEKLGGGVATAAGEVSGAKTPICPFWWIVLLGQTLLLGLYYRTSKSKKKSGFWWLPAPVLVVLAFLIDRYAHTHWYLPSKVCPFELWLGAGLAILETKFLRTASLRRRKARA